MQTEAVFENIAERIHDEISKAHKSIFIAVAWFTNKKLFDDLVLKAKNGCSVSLIISNDVINQNSKIVYEQLAINNSRVYKVGNRNSELMHNKFCIIDYNTVITGSYNWSYKAEVNFENVIVTYGDTALAEQFISEFNNIRKQYYPKDHISDTIFPINKVVTRLEIIKSYILLEDIEALNTEAQKIDAYSFNKDIEEILNNISDKEFSAAINKIQSFISKNQQLAFWTDPEIAALKLEIKNLENQLNAYDNEKTELEKLISEFQYRHTIELGEVILEILRLQKLKFKDDKAMYEEAEKDEKQYSEQFEAEKEKKVFELTDDEKIELKRKFRKATVLCHPDKVSDEFKNAANRIFIELKEVYEVNNLKRVSEILDELEKGNYFKAQSETVSKTEPLKAAIAKLKSQIDIIEKQIIATKESNTYRTIHTIPDWDEYFKLTKQKLEFQLKRLQLDI